MIILEAEVILTTGGSAPSGGSGGSDVGGADPFPE